MKRIGIFICNYNKKDYLITCIESILAQTYQDFDLYVVDNASTDGSVEKVRELFQDRVHLIVNTANLGGTGGFNSGLSKGLNLGYPYLMLIDNDVVLDPNAIAELYLEMNQNPHIGFLGAKILQLQNPDRIQDFGGRISFEQYSAGGIEFDKEDNDQYCETRECDYVSACCLMARADVVRKIGIMPHDTFIYWDDMEWSHICRRAGYQVSVCGKAKVWHNHTIKNPVNTFVRYYFQRNRIHFFAKYVAEDKIEHFIEHTLRNLFKMMYGDYYKKSYSELQATMFALDDFLHQVRGKAKDNRVMSIDSCTSPFYSYIKDAASCMIYYKKEERSKAENIKEKICEINSKVDVELLEKQSNKDQYQLTEQEKKCDYVFQMCSHATEVKQNLLPVVQIDNWCNAIFTEEDYAYFSNFESAYQLFYQMYHDYMKQTILQIKRNGIYHENKSI